MIFSADGKEYRRKIGFLGGLTTDVSPKATLDLVSFVSVQPEDPLFEEGLECHQLLAPTS